MHLIPLKSCAWMLATIANVTAPATIIPIKHGFSVRVMFCFRFLMGNDEFHEPAVDKKQAFMARVITLPKVSYKTEIRGVAGCETGVSRLLFASFDP